MKRIRLMGIMKGVSTVFTGAPSQLEMFYVTVLTILTVLANLTGFTGAPLLAMLYQFNCLTGSQCLTLSP